jgi:uncharacterized protein (TIGR00162 family)
LAQIPPLAEIQVRQFSSPSPVKPVLVCGLPGSGYVGKLAADYLVAVFKARKVAEFYSTSFPPHVNINEDGLAIKLRGELHHAQTGQENDLLVFTADAQPSTSDGEYELTDAVLKEAKKLHAELVFSLAAYVTGSFVKERRVFGTATSSELLPRLSRNGVQVMKEGGISGMNGIMVGMAKLHGMEGVSLLGETAGYLLDPAASHSVLGSLSLILGLKIDMTSIEKQAKEAQQIFSQVQRMTDQNAEEVRGTKEEGRPGYIA